MKFVIYLNMIALAISPILVFSGYLQIIFLPIEYYLYIGLIYVCLFLVYIILLHWKNNLDKISKKLNRPRLILPLISGIYWHTGLFAPIGWRENFYLDYYFMTISGIFSFIFGVFAYYFFSFGLRLMLK